jgi:transcriptional regulator with XRE-family HTH domain
MLASFPMDKEQAIKFGKLVKRQRLSQDLTASDLAGKVGMSTSHIGRIERGERFPSARMLRKMAQPLGFSPEELMVMAGYMNEKPPQTEVEVPKGHLDPFVARTLAAEPVETQRLVLHLLMVMKAASKGLVVPVT